MSRAKDLHDIRDLRGTWPQALASLTGAILLILTLRWGLIEPYVIPSGSMIPSLLIHDHIVVNKYAYGLRVPFTSSWLMRTGEPKRGEVIVFRSVADPSIYFVKRVVGLPGDQVRMGTSSELIINGKTVPRSKLDDEQVSARLAQIPKAERAEIVADYDYYVEELGDARPIIRLSKDRNDRAEVGPFIVPKDSVFMMGDNRDNSSDSRAWGAVPIANVLGRASLIWLSCEETLPESEQLCDPRSMRWDRMFLGVR